MPSGRIPEGRGEETEVRVFIPGLAPSLQGSYLLSGPSRTQGLSLQMLVPAPSAPLLTQVPQHPVGPPIPCPHLWR